MVNKLTSLSGICEPCQADYIRESVDSLCRDGSGPPIVCVHWRAVIIHERSCSKPFWTPSHPIRTFLYSMIPPSSLNVSLGLLAGNRQSGDFFFFLILLLLLLLLLKRFLSNAFS